MGDKRLRWTSLSFNCSRRSLASPIVLSKSVMNSSLVATLSTVFLWRLKSRVSRSACRNSSSCRRCSSAVFRAAEVRTYRNRQGLTKGKRDSTAKKPKKDPNHRTRPELAVEMIQAVSQWFPDRAFMVTGDSAYGGASVLQKLPSNVDLISHVHPKGALYKPAPAPRKGQKGPRRKKGARLPTMEAWAKSKQPWDTLKFDQFGLHATLLVKTRQALYYKAGKDRLLNIILVRDAKGKRPDQMFYCTCLDWNTRRILSAYACRWSAFSLAAVFSRASLQPDWVR